MMTPIILTGGIDLSIGSIVSLCAMVTGVLWQHAGVSIELAALAGLAAGLAAGAVNGGLVVLGLSPLVATLATMAFYAGLAMTISGSERITDFPQHFSHWSEWLGIPTHFWLLLTTAFLTYVVVHHTPFGRWCFAIGDNRIAARFAAVPVKRTEWILYSCNGLVAALVGLLYTVDRGAAIPDSHQGIELRAIACVVVGGTLITGGRGGVA